MAQFKYSINSPDGKIVTKVTTAPNRESAIKSLEKDGSLIVSLKEIKEKKSFLSFGAHLGQKDVLLIIKRVGDMTSHGFSVVDALKSIDLQTSNKSLKTVIQDIRHQIEMGNSFSDALAKYPKYFSTVFISLVKVGEESGTLSKVLRYLEKQEKQMYKLKKKAVGAMIYPAVIMGIMAVVGVGMVLFLIPFLKDIFSSFTADLPLPTRILMGSEEFLRTKWWLLLGGIITFVVGSKVLFKSKSFKFMWDKALLKIPFFGSLFKTYNSARIIRTFATLNKTGVPMIKSLDILSTVPKNSVYKSALQMVRDDVDKGTIFSAAIERFPRIFPRLVIESIKLGEDSGNLGDSMTYLAEVYEDEAKSQLQTMTKLIQPLLLVLVGAMVAGFALAVIIPLQRIPALMNG